MSGDEIFTKGWVSKRIYAVQIDLHGKNFLFRVNHLQPDSVLIEIRVEQDVFELKMNEKDWEYIYGQIKKENMKQAQLKWRRKKVGHLQGGGGRK
ncbi:hypothetical protein KY320_01450 [Candidatus Woesearchaeota archaeon]|nr:hypothetical protein [Candidatus Woesearchaeota archaeon]